MEPYNFVMCVPSLLELTDLTVVRLCLPCLCDGPEVMFDICCRIFKRRAPDIHVLVLLACVSHLLLTAPLSFRSALYVDVTELQTNFAPCQRMHFTHCATCERAPSVRGDTPIFSLAEVADFVACSHPDFSQKLAKLSVRHVRAMKTH